MPIVYVLFPSSCSIHNAFKYIYNDPQQLLYYVIIIQVKVILASISTILFTVFIGAVEITAFMDFTKEHVIFL